MTVTAYFHFESETPKNNFQKYHETFQLSQITLSVTYVNHCSLQTIVLVIGTVLKSIEVIEMSNEAEIGYIK